MPLFRRTPFQPRVIARWLPSKAVAAGTLTLLPMKNPSGTLLTSHTVHVSIINAVTLAHVLTLLSQTTDASTAVLALTNAAIVAGTDYTVTTVDPSAVAGDPCGARIYTAT